MTLYIDDVTSGITQLTGRDGCTIFENLGPDKDYSVKEENRTG
jgi:hypothetical protein